MTYCVTPKDAASLISVNKTANGPFILMGRRHDNLSFLPGFHVFPGGARERGNYTTNIPSNLIAKDEARLLKESSNPSFAKAIALTAIRETAEETDFFIGKPHMEHWKAGKAWSLFKKNHIIPDISTLRYFARAITPPTDHTRRFDARFFIASFDQKYKNYPHYSDELQDIQWVNPKSAEQLILKPIRKAILLVVTGILCQKHTIKKAQPIHFFIRGTKSHNTRLLTHNVE